MSYCSRSCRRRFTVLNFKSWAFSRICGHCQQQFNGHAQKRLFRNAGISFGDLATFPLIFLHFTCWMSFDSPTPIYKVRNFGDLETFSIDFCITSIYTSGLFYLLRQVWSWYGHPLPSYCVLAADMLRDLVTLTFDLLTLTSSHTWRVTWSTLPKS